MPGKSIVMIPRIVALLSLALAMETATGDIVNTTLVPASGSNATSTNKLAIQGTVLGGAIPMVLTPTGGAGISGTLDLDLEYNTGPEPIEYGSSLAAASIEDGDIALQDFNLSINMLFLGILNMAATSVRGHFMPSVPTVVTSDGDYGGMFELTGTTLVLNAGTIQLTTTGYTAGLLPSTTINLATSPLTLAAGPSDASIDLNSGLIIPGVMSYPSFLFKTQASFDVEELISGIAGNNSSFIEFMEIMEPAGSIWFNMHSTGRIFFAPEGNSLMLISIGTFVATSIAVSRRRRTKTGTKTTT